MESGDLRVFQMVAREGTITKAALRAWLCTIECHGQNSAIGS